MYGLLPLAPCSLDLRIWGSRSLGEHDDNCSDGSSDTGKHVHEQRDNIIPAEVLNEISTGTHSAEFPKLCLPTVIPIPFRPGSRRLWIPFTLELGC